MRRDAPTLGIDVGSTNTKLVLTEAGRAPGADAIQRFRTPDDPVQLLDGIEAAVRELISRHGAPSCVGVTSMAETGVPLDRDRRPLGELVRWNRPLADDLRGGVPPEPPFAADRAALFDATGVHLAPKTPLWMWWQLRRDDPDRWMAASRWAGVADLVTLWLTDRLVTDHTLAGRTGATRLPDPEVRGRTDFDLELLDLVGLSLSQLPEVLEPGAIAGGVTARASAATGIRLGTPVVVAGHDHAVATWAAGVRAPGRAVDSLGTTEALVRVADAPVDRAGALAAGMSVLRTVEGDREAVLAGAAGSAAVAAWATLADTDPTTLLAQLHDLDLPADGPVALPYPAGRQCPSPDGAARLGILDAEGGTPLPSLDTAPALLRGLALQLRWMDDAQRALLGLTGDDPAREPVLMLGSPPEAHAWRRASAAALPHPVLRVPCAEPVAVGAGLRAAVVAGLASADLTLATEPLEPGTASTADDWAAAAARFVAAATTTSTRGAA